MQPVAVWFPARLKKAIGSEIGEQGSDQRKARVLVGVAGTCGDRLAD